MAKSINIFETYEEFNAKRNELPKESLNYVVETGKTYSCLNPKYNYFYLEALEDNVYFGIQYACYIYFIIEHIEISLDKTNWTPASSLLIDGIVLCKGERVYFRGDGTNLQKGEGGSYNGYSLFDGMGFHYAIGGDLKTLLHPNDDLQDRAYLFLFEHEYVEYAHKLSLSSPLLKDYCYAGMFKHSSLRTSPKLQAKTLESNCYTGMFFECNDLKGVICLALEPDGSGTSTWMYGCDQEGTFVKHKDAVWPSGSDGIPETWTVINSNE